MTSLFSCLKNTFFWSCIFILYFAMAVPLSGEEPQDNIRIRLAKGDKQELPLENLEYYPLKKLKVALVLSGGGARGLSHIGILKAFEENNLPIDLIVGTSMGSIVGGFYAAGFSADEIHQIIQAVDWNSIFSDEPYRTHLFISQKSIPRRHLIQFRMDGIIPVIPSSISQGQKVFQILYNHLIQANFQARTDFDNLRIPLRIVATNLIDGQKVILDHGDLAEAINASVAFPLLFAPVEIDSMWLVDGGISDNLPVEVAVREHADVVVAVDATSALRKREEMQAPWEIADQVTTIMMENSIEESRLKADVVIKPDLHDYKGSDFSEADSIIQRGYRAALAKLSSLKKTIHEAEMRLHQDNIDFGAAGIAFSGISEELRLKFQDTLKTGLSGTVQLQDIESDLRMLYQSGYFEDVEALVERKNGHHQVTFFCRQFPKINEICFLHHQVFSDSVLETISRKFEGKPLNIKVLHREIMKLKDDLIGKGYSLADITSIKYIPSTHNLYISIDEGFVHEIKISGNQVTKDFVILREFPLKEGELFQADLVVQGIQNIYSTDLFNRVLINLEKEGEKNSLIIKVKEKKYLLARLGAHYSLERKVDAFMELLEDNFLGTSTKFSIFGSVGDFQRRLEATFFTVRVFKTNLTSSVSFYYKEREERYFKDFDHLGDYAVVRRGLQFNIGHQIETLGLISAEFRAENIDIGSEDPLFPYGEDYNLRSFTLRSVVDKRDKLPFPDKGIYNRWFWEIGNQKLLGSSSSFTKVFLGLEGYYPFLRNFNYHPYLLAGSSDLTLPFSEFFFLGGQKNFPGLYENEKFGRQFIQAGLELRYRLRWKLPIEAYTMMNYSLGAAWERPDDKIETSDFLHSISVSFVLNSLLGPIQLTYANVIEKRNIFYFSLGFDF